MGWKLTVRIGPRVQRSRFGELGHALDDLETRGRQIARDAPRHPVNVRVRRFEPSERVIARLELAGPQRLMPNVRAGVDVHGDGSLSAYRGRLRRQELTQSRGEDAFTVLRRTLLGT